MTALPETTHPRKTFDAERARQMAARTFDIEARALQGLAARLGEGFAPAVQVIQPIAVTWVAMAGMPPLAPAQHAEIVRSGAVDEQACPLSLAPNDSSQAQRALVGALNSNDLMRAKVI